MPGLYDTVLVNKVRTGDAVDYILGGNAVIGVVDEGPRILSVVDKGFDDLWGVAAAMHGDANHNHFIFVLIIDFLHLRHLGAAGRAPRAPEVDEHRLAAQGGKLQRLVSPHVYQGEIGCDIANVEPYDARAGWRRGWGTGEKPCCRSKYRKKKNHGCTEGNFTH